MRKANIALVVAALVLGCSGAAHAQVIDQQNTPQSPNGCTSIYTGCAVGQSFKPTLNHVDFVDLMFCNLNDMDGPLEVSVWVHESDVSGPVLGVSTPVIVSGLFAQARTFTFPTSVPLVPLASYAFTFHHGGGDSRYSNWGVLNAGDAYPDGRFYACGGSSEFSDAWFREGVFQPVPASPVSWGQVKAIYR